MKYLFINTVAGIGSTGKIAADKCRELQAQGHRCVLAYGRSMANCEDIKTYKIGTALDCRLHGLYTRLFDKHGFGSKAATRRFLKWVERYDPDIIWLHNIHGYYLNIEILFSYLKETGKKVYWTLHDCWAMTGHCTHFTAVECDRWKTQCLQCPQKNRYPSAVLFSNARNNFERKKKAFTGVEGMELVVPSHWLEGVVKESFLKEYKIEVIHNKIDIGIFKPTLSNFREKYGLENKKVILGVANVWDERKGLNDFIELSQMLDNRYAVVLVGLNQKQIKMIASKVNNLREVFDFGITDVQNCNQQTIKYASGTAIPPGIDNLYYHVTKMLGKISQKKAEGLLICMGKITSTQDLAAIYTMADVFVNPTYEDNYPTVNLEAQACGTPVITYDVGGCKETLHRQA